MKELEALVNLCVLLLTNFYKKKPFPIFSLQIKLKTLNLISFIAMLWNLQWLILRNLTILRVCIKMLTQIDS